MSEVEHIAARLRRELEAGADVAPGDRDLVVLPSRRRADRLWAVTAERPYLARPGLAGRVRGTALLPAKAVLRRLMRWYVEPLAIDQRQFNGVVLRLVDELHEHVGRLEARIRELEARADR